MMKNYQKILLNLSIVFLIFLIILFSILNIYSDQTNVLESNVSMNIPKYNNKIDFWYSGEAEIYYAFLPSYAEVNDVKLMIDKEKHLLIEEVGSFYDGDSLPRIELGRPYEYTLFTAKNSSIDVGTIYFVKMENVASVFVETDSGSMKSVDRDKEYKEGGEILVVAASGKIEFDGAMNFIKGRGNYSWDKGKNPYNIKLSEKVSLLGLEAGEKWVLLSENLDSSGLRNKLIYDFAQKIKVNDAIGSEMVGLYINGNYKGVYLLCERIEISSNCIDITNLEEKTEDLNVSDLKNFRRFDTSEESAELNGTIKGTYVPLEPSDVSGGYLLELDLITKKYNDEFSGFISNEGQAVIINSPEYASKNQVDYISGLFNEAEVALMSIDGKNPETGKYYYEYFDLESFVKLYLIEEIFGNVDASVSSIFLYKNQNSVDGLIYAGPIWDYDLSIGAIISEELRNATLPIQNANNFIAKRPYLNIADHEACVFTTMLYNRPEFQEAVEQFYEVECEELLETLIDNEIDHYIEVYSHDLDINNIRVKTDRVFVDEVSYLKKFLTQRIEFLSAAWVEKTPFVRVTMDANDKNICTLYYEVESGSVIDLPLLSAPGRQFLGWQTENGEYLDNQLIIEREITLLAKWSDESVSTQKRLINALKRYRNVLPFLVFLFMSVLLIIWSLKNIKK